MVDKSLIEGFSGGDRRALAKLITWLDDGGEPDRLLKAVASRSTGAKKVAITGSAGVGKSTMIGALVKHLRSAGRRVGVLMCDPASPRTGGALLGDRVRIDDDPNDGDLYIRSISTRGAPGGLSAAAGPIAQLLERFGFDVVLVETIGVGQDQVAARGVADVLVLVITPQGGDEVQWQKAGVMECADVIAVNKSDLGGADAIARSLRGISEAPVQPVSAETGEGIAELWGEIESHVASARS